MDILQKTFIFLLCGCCIASNNLLLYADRNSFLAPPSGIASSNEMKEKLELSAHRECTYTILEDYGEIFLENKVIQILRFIIGHNPSNEQISAYLSWIQKKTYIPLQESTILLPTKKGYPPLAVAEKIELPCEPGEVQIDIYNLVTGERIKYASAYRAGGERSWSIFEGDKLNIKHGRTSSTIFLSDLLLGDARRNKIVPNHKELELESADPMDTIKNILEMITGEEYSESYMAHYREIIEERYIVIRNVTPVFIDEGTAYLVFEYYDTEDKKTKIDVIDCEKVDYKTQKPIELKGARWYVAGNLLYTIKGLRVEHCYGIGRQGIYGPIRPQFTDRFFADDRFIHKILASVLKGKISDEEIPRFWDKFKEIYKPLGLRHFMPVFLDKDTVVFVIEYEKDGILNLVVIDPVTGNNILPTDGITFNISPYTHLNDTFGNTYSRWGVCGTLLHIYRNSTGFQFIGLRNMLRRQRDLINIRTNPESIELPQLAASQSL